MARALVHYLRLGTHAEKSYFEKGRSFYDRVVLNANLVEASRGATSVFAASNGKPYVIDPVTYAFGLDPRFLLSSTRNKNKPQTVKSTFAALAQHYGIPSGILGVRPLAPEDFPPVSLASLTERVVGYQQQVLQAALAEDAAFVLSEFDAIRPRFVVAPYFANLLAQDWSQTNLDAIQMAVAGAIGPVAGLLAYDARRPNGQSLLELGARYAETSASNLIIWPTNLDEHRSSPAALAEYAKLVRTLAASGKDVGAAYGGFFGLLLSFVGMSGVAHGVGYGDKRDLEPVVGGGLPPATYYVQALRDAIPVGDLAYLARDLPEDEFRDRICDCIICSGLLDKGGVEWLLGELSETEDRVSTSGELVAVPTAQVYRLTRFHYLANRAHETEWIGGAPSFSDVKDRLLSDEKWAGARLGLTAVSHLGRWIDGVEAAL